VTFWELLDRVSDALLVPLLLLVNVGVTTWHVRRHHRRPPDRDS
jgi:hypothetical protein